MLLYNKEMSDKITKSGSRYSNNFRYKLHAKVREEGYKVKPKSKTIFVPYNKVDNLSDNIMTLRDIFGYVVQVEII